MQGLYKFLSFFVVLFSIEANYLKSHRDLLENKKFHNWVKEHKIVARDENHLAHMFDNWISNDKFIEETNSRNLSYTLGHNAYSDMNSEEFSKFMRLGTNQDSLAKGDGFLRGSVPTLQKDGVLDVSKLTIATISTPSKLSKSSTIEPTKSSTIEPTKSPTIEPTKSPKLFLILNQKSLRILFTLLYTLYHLRLIFVLIFKT